MAEASPDLLQAERIDAVGDQFERDFRAGQQPRLEQFLAAADERLRPALFRTLLELELELRQKSGQLPQIADYEARFPAQIEQIQQAFEAASRPASMISSVKLTGVDTSKGPVPPLPAAEAAAKPAPKTLGRFEILSVLGEGAFGTVYRARDPQLDREVALKVPKFAGQQSREDRERFLREARAAAGLHHPQICPVHEVGTIDGRDYIVLAFIDGKPLSKILQAKPQLSDRQVVSVIRKLALALQEAHDKGIIHRDLKPANIMINRKGEPVIMDFGLARRENSGDAQISHSGQIMGTPAYMSPEQARGDIKAVGPAADIYSLGVVLYELLCGRRPFEGTVTEVIGQILHIEAPPPSEFRPTVDPRLQAICLKAISKKPQDRYASMKDFATALADFARAVPPAERPAADANRPAAEQHEEPHTTQFAQLLAAMASDVESKVERAVRRAGHPPKIPWWTYLVGSGCMGLVILLGIFFFIKRGDTTVIVQISIEKYIEDVNDPALSFMLDNEPITAAAFASPIELKPGQHELIVNRDGKLFKRFEFNVEIGTPKNEPVVVQDVTPQPREADLPNPTGGWVDLFNGKDLSGWQGAREGFEVVDGVLRCKPGSGGVLYTTDEYDDFVVQVEFKLSPGANNGLAIRYPGNGDPAFTGMCEVQLLDTDHPRYANLDPRQVHGSAYGLVAAQRGSLKPAGEWNTQQVTVRRSTVKVELNGVVILDADLATVTQTMGGKEYPGRGRRTGYFGFCGHGDPVEFRNIRIKELEKEHVIQVDGPDRKAAEYLLSLGGGFVKVNGQDRQIRHVNGLPTEPFRLTGAYFADVKALDDNDLAVLKDCVHLTELDLRSTRVTERGLEIFRGKTNFTSLGLAYLRVTDKGLEIFKDNKGLKALFLHDTFLTDKGLSLFHDCKELGTLWVGGTPITDTGMLPFRDCTFLKWLDVRATRVTRDGVRTMKAALPACRVDADPDKR